MQNDTAKNVGYVRLLAKPIQTRIRIHPGIRDYFKDQDASGNAALSAFIERSFLASASDQVVAKYLMPYENQTAAAQLLSHKEGE